MGARATAPNSLLIFTYQNPPDPMYLAENIMRTKRTTWATSCSISVPFLKCKHECLGLAMIIVIVITKARVIQVTSELKLFKSHKLGAGWSCYFKKNVFAVSSSSSNSGWCLLSVVLSLHTLHYYKYIQGVHMTTHLNAWQYLCDK